MQFYFNLYRLSEWNSRTYRILVVLSLFTRWILISWSLGAYGWERNTTTACLWSGISRTKCNICSMSRQLVFTSGICTNFDHPLPILLKLKKFMKENLFAVEDLYTRWCCEWVGESKGGVSGSFSGVYKQEKGYGAEATTVAHERFCRWHGIFTRMDL